MSRNQSAKAERLAELYARIPDVGCKGLCQSACGPVGMTDLEYRRILARRGGSVPVMTTITCPLLSADQRCSVYADRPLICRLWAAVRAMPCPWGCRPEEWLDPMAAAEIQREIADLSGDRPFVYLAPTGWEPTKDPDLLLKLLDTAEPR